MSPDAGSMHLFELYLDYMALSIGSDCFEGRKWEHTLCKIEEMRSWVRGERGVVVVKEGDCSLGEFI